MKARPHDEHWNPRWVIPVTEDDSEASRKRGGKFVERDKDGYTTC